MSKISPFAGTLGFNNNTWATLMALNGAMMAPTSSEIIDQNNPSNQQQQEIDSFNQFAQSQLQQIYANDAVQNDEEIKEQPIVDQQPTVEQPVVEQPIVEQDEEVYEDDDELQPLIQEIEQQPPPPDEDDNNGQLQYEYRSWRQRLVVAIMRANWNGILDKTQLITDLLAKGSALYWFWKERNTLTNNPDDTETTDNEQFYQNSQSRPLPPQCRRTYYTDGNGKLKSLVMCESFGEQRLYHNY